MSNDVFDQEAARKLFCPDPFYKIEVREDGEIYTCCPAFSWKPSGEQGYSIGNFNTDSFDQIWNGERARGFRRSILDGSYKYCNTDKCLVYANHLVSLTENQIEEKFFENMAPPKIIDFGHDRQCNVRCVMCRDYKVVNSAQEAKMLDDKIETIFLPMVQNAESVAINGAGEALASRHCRNLIQRIAKEYPHIKFKIRSNGILCDQKNFEQLGIMDKVDAVLISLHATTKKTYNKIVLGSDFDKIMKNLHWLSKMKKENKINKLILISVVSKLSYKEIIKFVKLSKTFGATASFLEYLTIGTQIDKDYHKIAIFNKEHREYNKLVKLLQNDILKTEKANFSPVFQNLKPISTREWLKYRLKELLNPGIRKNNEN